jgi:hypothetical protein
MIDKDTNRLYWTKDSKFFSQFPHSMTVGRNSLAVVTFKHALQNAQREFSSLIRSWQS